MRRYTDKVNLYGFSCPSQTSIGFFQLSKGADSPFFPDLFNYGELFMGLLVIKDETVRCLHSIKVTDTANTTSIFHQENGAMARNTKNNGSLRNRDSQTESKPERADRETDTITIPPQSNQDMGPFQRVKLGTKLFLALELIHTGSVLN
jgi:hypothetical protein